MAEALPRDAITGLVLAGGRGSRMGGADKGLLPLHGLPLAAHVLARLRQQVGALMISANRNLDAYRALGVPVWADDFGSFEGPLAGWLAGLRHCATPWLLCVPCDSPFLPADLAQRLATTALAASAPAAMVATIEDGVPRRQPVFCLLQRALMPSLADYLKAGERKIDRWVLAQGGIEVPFDDASAFVNANTAQALAELQPPGSAGA